MLEDKNILNKPEILRREAALREPVRKKRGWLFKLILILIGIGLAYYLFTNPDIIIDPVNKFFGRFS
jgi:hypothetical protein